MPYYAKPKPDWFEVFKLPSIIFLFLFLAWGCGPKTESSSAGSLDRNDLALRSTAEKSLLEISFKIDPAQKTVGLITRPGPDAASIGTVNAMFFTYTETETYKFAGNLVLIFVSLEGTDIGYDLSSVRLQITDLGSDRVRARNVNLIIPGYESLVGIQLAGGFNKKGLPYYSYGDFYATERALVYNNGGNGAPSRWTWCLCFDLGPKPGALTIKGKVIAHLPADHSSSASFSIQPYLNNLTTHSVTIFWETNRESKSELFYGLNPACPKRASGTMSRFLFTDPYSPIHPPNFLVNLHQVKLDGLKPGRTYYYQVRAAKYPSPVYSFKTLSDQAQTFRFAVIGDTQFNDAAHSSVINRMTQYDFDFFVHLGDFQDGFTWPSLRINFFSIEQPLVSYLPIFPVRGNHDELLWYLEYFDTPATGISELDKRFYSFNYQGAYFVVIDSGADLAPGDTAYNWLESTLAQAQSDPQRKFTFVFSHIPFYSGYDHFGGLGALSEFGPLFKQYDVSAGFAGHVHLYERLDVSGKPFFISGGGGGAFYNTCFPDLTLLDQESSYSGETVTDQVHDCSYEFLLVEVGADYFSVKAYDQDDNVIDTVTYQK